MHLIYIDDSRDPSGLCVFSALAIPAEQWKTAFATVREYRRELKAEYGLYMRKEFHATEFVSGRGNISDKTIFKGTRCKIFLDTLERIGKLPHVKLFNAALTDNKELWAFERLLNRINRTMRAQRSTALLLCDEGKESIYTRLARKMAVHNPIPSMYGAWSSGQITQNIPLDLILEDPIFKKSHSSYFIQLADFCAYALLRREVRLPSKDKYGLHQGFALLSPILTRECNPKDPDGVIR